jgi:hypothetical protein
MRAIKKHLFSRFDSNKSEGVCQQLSQSNISLPSSKRRLNRTDMNVENNELK